MGVGTHVWEVAHIQEAIMYGTSSHMLEDARIPEVCPHLREKSCHIMEHSLSRKTYHVFRPPDNALMLEHFVSEVTFSREAPRRDA